MKKMQIPNIVIPLRLFLFLLASIFIIEFLIMFFLGHVCVPSRFANIFLDSTLLVVILYPILYKFVFRKMVTELKERKYLDEKLSKINEELETKIRTRTNDLVSANRKLQEEILERGRTEEKLKKNYDLQSATNSVLRLSLEDIPLEELLERVIDIIFSISWLVFESRGSIFLAEDVSKILVLKAQRGLSEEIQRSCAQRPFGSCLCGLAASEQRTQFADHIDDRHPITYNGIIPHGHYCVPILFSGKTLGVINVYTKEGRVRSREEEEFLTAVANTLASIIVRRQAETDLKKAYLQLQEMQDQLIQAEKLNAIGQLASGVAHEVRNPLSIILQGVEYLEMKIPPKETPAFQALSMIKDSVKRADNIISLLFDFSKAARLNLDPENINPVLESSINLVRTKVKFMNIDIVKETKKDMPKIMIDKNKMEQVFINLLLNAIQAMPEGGKIFIRSYDKRLEAPGNGAGERKEDYFKVGEKAVIVEIEDTGTGIPEENLKKVFDPFFTTKGPGGGAGLGLSVSRNIIIMHKGLINVTSQLGKGTRITVTLHAIE